MRKLVVLMLVLTCQVMAAPPQKPPVSQQSEQQILDNIEFSNDQLLPTAEIDDIENDLAEQQDEFGDIDINDIVISAEQQTQIESIVEVEQNLKKLPAKLQEKGVGVKGEPEAILNKLDKSNLMDYQQSKIKPKVFDLEPEGEDVEPPL